MEHFQYLPPKHRNVIHGCCPHYIPLHCKVGMDCNITERHDIAPLYLRVLLAKCFRKVGSSRPNYCELPEDGGLVEFACQEPGGIHSLQKCLDHIASFKDVL